MRGDWSNTGVGKRMSKRAKREREALMGTARHETRIINGKPVRVTIFAPAGSHGATPVIVPKAWRGRAKPDLD